MPGLRQAGDVVDLDYAPFFIDRVEDAVPPGPQAPQIRRPVRERLRRPRLIGQLADGIPERRDTDVIVEGPAAAEYQRLFIAAWRLQGRSLVPRNYFPRPQRCGDVVVRVIASSPESRQFETYKLLIAALAHARRRHVA